MTFSVNVPVASVLIIIPLGSMYFLLQEIMNFMIINHFLVYNNYGNNYLLFIHVAFHIWLNYIIPSTDLVCLDMQA